MKKPSQNRYIPSATRMLFVHWDYSQTKATKHCNAAISLYKPFWKSRSSMVHSVRRQRNGYVRLPYWTSHVVQAMLTQCSWRGAWRVSRWLIMLLTCRESMWKDTHWDCSWPRMAPINSSSNKARRYWKQYQQRLRSIPTTSVLPIWAGNGRNRESVLAQCWRTWWYDRHHYVHRM